MSEVHISILLTDKAQVWYAPETDQVLLRHVLMEGEFAVFYQNEHDAEFTPHWEIMGWEFVGEL
jgi:hypothetical protein